jgi:hypothetical protein
MLGLRIMPLVYLAAALTALWALWSAIDAYGDYRADQVHLLYAKAAGEKNEELDAFAAEDAPRAQKTLAELRARVAKAAGVKSDLPYSAEQAAAITAIRRAAQ